MSDNTPEKVKPSADRESELQQVRMFNFARLASRALGELVDNDTVGVLTQRGVPTALVVPFGDNSFMKRLLDAYPDLLEDATKAPEMELTEPEDIDSLAHPCFGLDTSTRLAIVADVE